jgi:beta-ribofuranosylaminobenzene 5'-phosphate synthase
VGRGGTSGIGTAAFEKGGFIVDGGHRLGGIGGKSGFLPSSASADVPPALVTVREDFPADWKVLLVVPEGGKRVSGTQELDHFRTFCPLPPGEVQEVCHQLVVRVLPGIIEHDLALFSAGVNRLSEIGFKKVEISLQDPLVPGLIKALSDTGAACAGMSSFGPAVYAVTDGDTGGLEQAARAFLGERKALFFHTTGVNHGAVVKEYPRQ